MRREIPALLLVGAIAQACSCDSVPDDALTSCELNQVVQGAVQTDILFVIDDSGSMDEEVVNLEAKFQAFLNVLNGSVVANDFQIGVTTTSVADFTGALVGAKGALLGPAPLVLQGGDPDLVADFNAKIAGIRAIIGANAGSGKEQPFRAMELAVSEPLLSGTNAGFLRPGSRLAVIFLSDEDDCSESATNNADGNRKCHNEGRDAFGDPDGIDYKFSRIDSVDHYESFLRGAIGGQPRDIVLGSIVGVDEATHLPTCGDTGNAWCCGNTTFNNTCAASVCGSNVLDVGGLSGSTYCCGTGTGTCTSPCATAYDKADRFAALLSRFPSNKRITASVCAPDYTEALSQIAGLIASPTVPLEGEPADYRMMVVALRSSDGSRIPCTVALEGTPEAATADAVYAPAQGASPATLTFPDGGGCALVSGEHKIEIDVICAG